MPYENCGELVGQRDWRSYTSEVGDIREVSFETQVDDFQPKRESNLRFDEKQDDYIIVAKYSNNVRQSDITCTQADEQLDAEVAGHSILQFSSATEN